MIVTLDFIYIRALQIYETFIGGNGKVEVGWYNIKWYGIMLNCEKHNHIESWLSVIWMSTEVVVQNSEQPSN